MAQREFGPFRPVRAFRDHVVDGDDVWPPLAFEELQLIAAVDREIAQGELDRSGGRLRKSSDEAGGAVYSVAERVRHYRDLVADLEMGQAADWAMLTELRCRDMAERHLRGLPETLQRTLRTELLDPLDQRYRAATEPDGGAFLRESFPGERIPANTAENWRWARRPRAAPAT